MGFGLYKLFNILKIVKKFIKKFLFNLERMDTFIILI